MLQRQVNERERDFLRRKEDGSRERKCSHALPLKKGKMMPSIEVVVFGTILFRMKNKWSATLSLVMDTEKSGCTLHSIRRNRFDKLS